jgi:hypothetical protein
MRFAIVLYYLLWNYRSKGCHSGGAEALHAVVQKEREKMRVRISTKPVFLENFHARLLLHEILVP